MIKDPVALIAFLAAVEFGVLWLAAHPETRRWFTVVPSIFWIYALPMLSSTFGLIDPLSPVYSQLTSLLLPMSLFLLLLSVDVRGIGRLGPLALTVFAAGVLGIGLGMISAFGLFQAVVGRDFWSGFGALAGSWTGGSANMIAVKEALGTPEPVFLSMVVVDTVVPYAWMGFLVITAGSQSGFDRINRSRTQVLPAIESHAEKDEAGNRFRVGPAIVLLLLAAAAGWLCRTVALVLPVIPQVITQFAWTILGASTLGILVSLTPLRRVGADTACRTGNWLLFFVLTTIGAKASLTQLGHTGWLILAGMWVVMVHALVLLMAGRPLRAPLCLLAAASQACVGGVASAPMVAEIYRKGFAPVGLLLAILGNVIGTYFGIMIGQMCRLLPD